MARETWRSTLGFGLAAIGSAIGLANVVKFPYMVGNNGGAAFIIIYLLSLAAISVPVLISEALIGRTARLNPCGAFRHLGGTSFWSGTGLMIVLTGLIVSSFYSALAGWILGYLIEALKGTVSTFTSIEEASAHYQSLISSPWWGLGFHLAFLLCCAFVLYSGVRRGIEVGCEIMMPILFLVLLILVIKGLSMPGARDGLRFLLKPDWSAVTSTTVILALGQSFFTLSAGQGTMITYGSYLSEQDSLLKVCIPVALADTVISLLAAVAVFTIVFSSGAEPTQGMGLIFHTLPTVFSELTGGYVLAVLFFLLVFLAAVTSEISAMEPVIAYLVDEKGLSRSSAVAGSAVVTFLLGIPCALSYSILSEFSVFGHNFLDAMDFVATSILIPLGGFAAVLLVGWKWGIHPALEKLRMGAPKLWERHPWIAYYLRFSICYVAPALIGLVFLHALGVI